MFSIEAGLIQLCKWSSRTTNLHSSFHSFQSRRGGQHEGYQHFDEFLENEDTVFAQSPFQPDPKAINLTTRKEFFESNDLEEFYFCESDLQKVLSCQMFWSQDTFTAWRRHLEECDPDRWWTDPAENESESESESESEYEPDEREVYNPDNYEFETMGDYELGEELWCRWRDSSTTMGFQEWMDNEIMCGEGDSEDEDEFYN